MESLVKEHLNFKKVYESLEKRENLSAKYLDFQFKVVSWDEVPGSNVYPSSIRAQDKLVLAYKQLDSKIGEKNGFEDSYTNGDESYNGNSSVLDESDKEEVDKYPAVSMGQARSLLSLFCLWKDESMFPTTPLWVVCDGIAPEHVFLMGCAWLHNEARQHVINTYTISCQGPYHSKNDIPSVPQLMEEFSQPAVFNVTAKGYAHYDVLGANFSERTMIEPGGETKVVVECEWEDVEMMLEVPHGAKCQLSVKAVPGDSRIASYTLYLELQMLKDFITGIKKGEVKWNRHSDEESTFFKKLQELLVEEESGGNVDSVEELKKEEDESALEDNFIPPRKDLDFTERLWNYLKGAGGLQELRMALQTVMQTLKTGDFYPVVHVHNDSRLASQIRACYQQQTPSLSLEGVEPLEILIEMGLEKLRRDYTDFFIRQEVVLHEQLCFFLESGLSTEEQVERLCRMHNVLELLVVTAMLDLPLKNRQTLCRLGLKYYEKFSSDNNQTLQIPVEASHLYGIYSKGQPCLWGIDITPDGSSLSSALYQLNITAPFNDVTSSTDESRMDANGDCLTYYSTHVQRNCLKPL